MKCFQPSLRAPAKQSRLWIATSLTLLAMTLFANPAFAACLYPTGSNGALLYNSDNAVFQYCDDSAWVGMGQPMTGTAPPTSGLIHYWPFDETSGTTATDIVGGVVGALENSPVWSASGHNGGAIHCNYDDIAAEAVAPRINLGTAFDLPAPPFTLSVWARPTNFDDWRTIIGKRNGGGAKSFELQFQPYSGQVSLLTSATGGAYFAHTATAGAWTNIVLVADTSNTKLYADGVLKQTTAIPFANGAYPGAYANICDQGEVNGGSGDADPYRGYIDELRIYNRALTYAEVLAIYSYSGDTGTGCLNPVGTAGTMIYNDTSNVLQYCDGGRSTGNGWIALGPIPGAGGAGCTSPTGSEGALIYNADYKTPQYCDGANWIRMGAEPRGSCDTPITFRFPDLTFQDPNATVTSEIIPITGITCSTAVSIAGGGSPQYRICADSACSSVDQTWGSAGGNITNGKYIQLRLTTPTTTPLMLTSATFTAGTVTDSWDVTTQNWKYIFVTSTLYDGSLGGLAGGDTKCNTQAAAGGLPGTYKAWLSTTAGNDPQTLWTKNFTMPYRLPNAARTKVADDWSDLTDYTIGAAINVYEDGTGAAASSTVWTNTDEGGYRVGGTNCTNWTTNGAGNGRRGNRTLTSGWSNAGATACATATSSRLFCVQQ